MAISFPSSKHFISIIQSWTLMLYLKSGKTSWIDLSILNQLLLLTRLFSLIFLVNLQHMSSDTYFLLERLERLENYIRTDDQFASNYNIIMQKHMQSRKRVYLNDLQDLIYKNYDTWTEYFLKGHLRNITFLLYII